MSASGDYEYPRPAVLDELPLARSACIEASAGTGKTYTLEHLVVDLIVRAGARLSEIVVLTFTERATLEMRERVRELLERVLAGPASVAPGDAAWTIDAEARARLQDALHSFDSANVHTIHGFCQRVLGDHAFGSRGLFELDVKDPRASFVRGAHDVLREALRPGDRDAEVIRAYLESAGAGGLLQLLWSWATVPVSATRPRLEDLDRAALSSRLHSLGRDVERALGGASAARRGMPAKIRGATERLRRAGLEALSAPNEVELVRRLDAARRLAQGSTMALEWLRLRAARDAALGEALGPLFALFDGIPTSALLVVQRVLPRVSERARAIRRAEGELGFDDMLTRLRDALRDESEDARGGLGGHPLRDALRRQFRFAIVDEFQDTDPVQWEIFRRVFLGRPDAEAEAASSRSALYLIGDPKQAIYAFRGADVRTYLRARDEILEGGVRVDLKANFRSTAPMVEAYNAIFAETFFRGEIRYDHPVVAGRRDLRAVTRAGECAESVVLLCPRVPAEATDSPSEPPRVSLQQLRVAFAERIAREVHELVGEGSLRVGPEGEERGLRLRDIFVLGRTERELAPIADALAARGLHYAYFKPSGLFATREASDVLALLRAVADPSDLSRALAAWLTPFFGLDLRDIEGLEGVEEDHPLRARLRELHALCGAGDYAAFATEALIGSGLTRRELFARESERRLTNYEHLIEIVLNDAHESPRSIEALASSFADRVEGRFPAAEDTQRVASAPDAVQLLTMHKAKGLEAEVVFVVGGLSTPRTRSREPVRVPTVDGDETHHYMAPLPPGAQAVAAHARAEEEERVAYVALTRARSRLYLPFFGEVPELGGRGLERTLPENAPYARTQRALERLRRRGGLKHHVIAAPIAGAAPVAAPSGPESMDTSAEEQEGGGAPSVPCAPSSRPEFARLREERAAPIATSYSRMRQGHPRLRVDSDGAERSAEALVAPVDAEPNGRSDGEDALPGGAAVGLFLHEGLERVDLAWAHAGGTYDDDSDEGEAFRTRLRSAAQRHGVDPAHLRAGAELVLAAARARLPRGDGGTSMLAEMDFVAREMEFEMAIPEAAHPRLAALSSVVADERPFAIHRGVLRGIIDVVYSAGGRTYFVDWKSDRLKDASEAGVSALVSERYQLQAELYTLATLRSLAVRDEEDYEARFGGGLYVFLRPPGLAIAHFRPSFSEAKAFVDKLESATFSLDGRVSFGGSE